MRKQRVQGAIWNNDGDVYHNLGWRLGQILAAIYRIHLSKKTTLILLHPYPAESIGRQLESNKDSNKVKNVVADPATTEWAFPIVHPSRKDCNLQFCIEDQKFRAVTVHDSYPKLWMNKFAISLSSSKMFLTLNAESLYWHRTRHTLNIYGSFSHS